MTDNAFTQRLRALIGRNCCYFGRDCRIVEILPETDRDQGHLVLEAFDQLPPIQTDQFGQAVFRANEHIEVPIHGAQGDFSDELVHLLDSLDASHCRTR
ncbi:MAG: hypothetical protein ACLFQI_01540 [Halochromatium sp.]|uniref:hypothetical protein n=1 Tax=Halochromatium sp. TaxID=2049430 RepID=UPI00397A239E